MRTNVLLAFMLSLRGFSIMKEECRGQCVRAEDMKAYVRGMCPSWTHHAAISLLFMQLPLYYVLSIVSTGRNLRLEREEE